MIKLINIEMTEFKEIVYPEYVKLFPKEERKPYKMIEESYQKGILNIIKIVDDDIFVGFVITNSIKNNKYLQIDYFAILPQYQNKGYGTKVFKILQEISKEYYGLFIEIEKLGLGESDKENKIRIRRAEFYERIGFYKLNFDLNLFNVIYTPYVLPTSYIKEEENKIIEDIFAIYTVILGEEKVKCNCSIVKLQ